jgi:DNA polymerase-1
VKVVIDIETERLEDPEHIWVIVCKDVTTGKKYVFQEPTERPEECERFKRFAEEVTHWIGHHIIKFDLPIINKLLKTDIPLDKDITDTLVVSRLINQPLEGGHSLENLGNILKFPKNLFDKFDKYYPELEERCANDVELTWLVYSSNLKYIESPLWKQSLDTEHYSEYLTYILNYNGFHFNIEKATEYFTTLSSELDSLRVELAKIFPKRAFPIQEVLPKATKSGSISLVNFKWLDGNDLTPYTAGAPFTRFEYRDFNPSSTPQAIERLWEFRWQPINKSKGHTKLLQQLKFKRKLSPEDKIKLDHFKVYGWKLDDTNLDTIPKDAPESIRKLTHWLKVKSRVNTLEQWITAYKPTTGRIHGKWLSIGAWTHRKSHSDPNMGNVPAPVDKFDKPAYYGKEFRELWDVPKGRKLIGVDAEGIQLRVLAHYINDQRFTDSVTKGNKKDGTDPHSLNAKALGDICNGRGPAKRFIYAWLLGAGTGMVGHILECNHAAAQQAVDNFIEFYPGLKELKKKQIPYDALKGYFKGFDGRYVAVPGEHWVLAGYLQNGESVIMKTAAKIWYPKLIKAKIPFKLVNDVHDEWQTEVDDDVEICNYVSEVQCDAIRETGEILKLNCPLAGEAKQGYNWYQTH